MKFMKTTAFCLAVFEMFNITFSSDKAFESIKDKFSNAEKISYSTDYTELSSKKNSHKKWRQGMISGNGLQGVITSGSPYEDTLIYQNMHFIMSNQNPRECPDTSSELEDVKQAIVKGEDITDNSSYDDVYSFHPGGVLRISQKHRFKRNYTRWTDYETAQVGVQYTDSKGTWTRKTFTSKSDDVTITEIGSSSKGKKVNLTLSFDNISAIGNFKKGSEVDLKYKKIADENADTLSFVAHYPNYEASELKNGGYATTVKVICIGGEKSVVNGKKVKDTQYCSDENPQIEIKNADTVYLVAVSDRTHDMSSFEDFDSIQNYAIVDVLKDKINKVVNKYTDLYDEALAAHTALFTPVYNSVEFKLEESASTERNEKLLSNQRRKKELNSSLLQRAYYSGRYAYLCSSGYSTPRLYGMWIGEWNPSWGSKYTMDANVNLQTSSMNTGNMPDSVIGYAQFILRQVDDWEVNAKNTHGFTNAIQAPVNTDGDDAYLIETCYPYPFRYWNAGTSWMLQPLYESLQCYGDIQIPITDEYDLTKLKSVLSLSDKPLTDKQIEKMSAKGYLDLRSEILLPLLIKSCNYWDQMCDARYYTDAEFNIKYDAKKKDIDLEKGERYAILPSYSPENNPSNYSSPSDANCAIDISAAKSNIEMLLEVQKSVNPKSDTSKWEDLLSKLPDYSYDETGAIKEWACNQFDENNLHRHLSHLYCAWPNYETKNDKKLKAACIQAVENRESENEASHALVHRSLIAARLNDRDSLSAALLKLMNHKIHYDSLMTNHDYDRGSAYCTDFAIGYLGIVNESLVYSNDGVIEILPCVPTSGFESGKITGLRARTNATIESLEWNLSEGKATVAIRSDVKQKLTISCGMSDEKQKVSFAENQLVILDFNL